MNNPVASLTAYERGHLVAHLAALQDDSAIHRLLELETDSLGNAWYETHLEDGELAEYLDDVQIAWRMSEASTVEDNLAAAINIEWRYALITTTIRSLAAKLPASLLGPLVEAKSWPLDQALRFIEQSNEWEWRVRGYLSLVPTLLKERPEHLTSLVRELRHPSRPTSRNVVGLGGIRDPEGPADYQQEYLRAVLIRKLASRLTTEHSMLLDAASAIRVPWSRAAGLTALAPYLPKAALTDACARALDMTFDIGRPSLRSATLVELIPCLEGKARDRALEGAWDAWKRSMTGDADESRFAATRADGIFRVLAPVTQAEEYALPLRRLAPWLNASQVAEAISIANAGSSIRRDVLLAAMVLGRHPMEVAEIDAATIKHPYWRMLATYPGDRSTAMGNVDNWLELARTMPSPDHVAKALLRLAASAAESDAVSLILEAVEASKDAVGEIFVSTIVEEAALVIKCLSANAREQIIAGLCKALDLLQLEEDAVAAMAGLLSQETLKLAALRAYVLQDGGALRRSSEELGARRAMALRRAEVPPADAQTTPHTADFYRAALQATQDLVAASKERPNPADFAAAAQQHVEHFGHGARFGALESWSGVLADKQWQDDIAAASEAIIFLAVGLPDGLRADARRCCEDLANPRQKARALGSLLNNADEASRAPLLRETIAAAVAARSHDFEKAFFADLSSTLRTTDTPVVLASWRSALREMSADYHRYVLEIASAFLPVLESVAGPTLRPRMIDTVDRIRRWWDSESSPTMSQSAEDVGSALSGDGEGATGRAKAALVAALAGRGEQAHAQFLWTSLLADPATDPNQIATATVLISEAAADAGDLDTALHLNTQALERLDAHLDQHDFRMGWIAIAHALMYRCVHAKVEASIVSALLLRTESMVVTNAGDERFCGAANKAMASIQSQRWRFAPTSSADEQQPIDRQQSEAAPGHDEATLLAELRLAGIRLKCPSGYVALERRNSTLNSAGAWRALSLPIDVYLLVRRETDDSIEEIYRDMFQTLSEEPFKLARFPPDAVKSEFGADDGGTWFFEPRSQVSRRQQAMGVWLQAHGMATAGLLLFFDPSGEPISDALKTFFYAIKFDQGSVETMSES